MSIVSADVAGSGAPARVRLEAQAAVHLDLGQSIEISADAGGRTNLSLSGHVVSLSRCDGITSVLLALDDKSIKVLVSLDNHRRAVRVRPTKDTPVRARILLEGAPYDAVVRDISQSGIGLLIPPELEQSMSGVWEVELELYVPDVEDPLALHGTIYYRRLQGAAVHFGVGFNAEQVANFPAAQELIRATVMRIQREELRRHGRSQ